MQVSFYISAFVIRDFLVLSDRNVILLVINVFSVYGRSKESKYTFLYARLETGLYYVIGYGGRACVHTGFRTITLVLYIGSLPNLAT